MNDTEALIAIGLLAGQLIALWMILFTLEEYLQRDERRDRR